MENRSTQTPRVVRTGKPSGKKKKTVSKGRKALAAVGKLILTVGLIMIITGCIVGTALTIYVIRFIDSDSAIDLNDLKMNYTTQVYALDADGNDVEIQRLNRGENRVWVDLKDIPVYVQDAFVAFEDERFYSHDGVDFKRTVAAVLNEFKRIVIPGADYSKFGASTISQQLVKNINGDVLNRTFDVKIKEIMQAMNLERHYTKDQILEAYLNYIGLHFNTNGVQAGAQLYFHKNVSELTLPEAASLAAITKSPANYNPINNPENNVRRRNNCLKKMSELNNHLTGQPMISEAEYQAAVAAPLFAEPEVTDEENPDGETAKETDEKEEENEETKTTSMQSYFVDALIEEVIEDLMAANDWTYDYAEQMLYTKGYKIYSTMEIETQATLEKHFTDLSTFDISGLSEEEIPEASMVIEDLNGNVRALVGGKGEKTNARGFNRATMAVRSFGSTVKPLAIYSQAFEKGIITWSTVMDDNPIQIIGDDGEERDYPNNYNKVFDGDITIIDALKVSKNTIPVKLCQMLTPQSCFEFMQEKLHFHDLRDSGTYNDVTLGSMALGDGGTTLVDLVNAYQIFGNGGYFSDHKMYSKVTDANGKVLLDVTMRPQSQVLSSQTAYIMNRGLWCVVNDGGSGSPAKLSKWETIGKTGTSNDRKDLLFMGVTPYYVAGIRYGLDDNSPMSDKIVSQHSVVWKKIMEDVHKDLNPAKFELNDTGVVEYTYCAKTGYLAGEECEETKTGYYNSKFAPPSQCEGHEPEAEDPTSSDFTGPTLYYDPRTGRFVPVE